jgi:hypothetical protein
MNHEEMLRKAAAEIRAADLLGWGNACEWGADRIAELEAALRKYGKHAIGSDCYPCPRGVTTAGQCTCGLSAALDTSETPADPLRRCPNCGRWQHAPDCPTLKAAAKP